MSLDDAWGAFSRRLFDQNLFAIKLGLDNIRRALDLEGHPERTAPAIVVGGTNGKGSTAAALAAILQAHGLKVGLYTSPHLIELRERFRIDGVPVSRARVLDVGRGVLTRYGAEDADPCLTFFELTTLMASKIFAAASVDVAVWEVGLGGRLDAVNAIEPAMTVVTNIDLDHQKYLGDTIEAVASEKAGLRRPDVPLILGPQTHPQVARVFDFPETVALENDDYPAGEEAQLRRIIDWSSHVVDSRTLHENRRTAIAAAREFLGQRWSRAAESTGLSRSRWPGRLDPRTVEVGGVKRRFLLDAAHNPAGTDRLYELFAHDPPGAVVIGAMADKDHSAMFEPLARLNALVYIADIASERAASSEQICATFSSGAPIATGAAGEMFALAARSTTDRYVCVFGSIYLLGEWFAWANLEVDALATWV